MTTFICGFRSWRRYFSHFAKKGGFESGAARRAGNMVDRRSAVKSPVVSTEGGRINNIAILGGVGYNQLEGMAIMASSAMDDLSDTECAGRPGEDGREHLAYLADLLGELQRMAEREGCRRLSRMLAISHSEAVRETHRRTDWRGP